MKKLVILALLAGLVPATTTQAQVFGQYIPAEVLAVNARSFGAYVNLSENMTGALAQLRLSFYPNVDFGFQGGLSRDDVGTSTKTRLCLGADVRFGAMKATPQVPVDVTVGAALGAIESTDGYSCLMLGPSVVASHTYVLSSAASIAPYVGTMLLISSVNDDHDRTNDFSVPFRVGAELRTIPGVRIVAELQLHVGEEAGDDMGFSAGVNLPF